MKKFKVGDFVLINKKDQLIAIGEIVQVKFIGNDQLNYLKYKRIIKQDEEYSNVKADGKLKLWYNTYLRKIHLDSNLQSTLKYLV